MQCLMKWTFCESATYWTIYSRPGSLNKCRFWFSGCWWGLRFYVSPRPPDVADATGPGSTLKGINTVEGIIPYFLDEAMETEKGKLKVIGQLEAEPRLILPRCPLECHAHFCTSQVAIASCITGESAVCKMSFCLVLPFPFVSQDNKGWRLLYLPIFFQLVTHLLRCADSHPGLPSMIPATSVTRSPSWGSSRMDVVMAGNTNLGRDLGDSLPLGKHTAQNGRVKRVKKKCLFFFRCHKHRILEQLLQAEQEPWT